MLELWRMHSTPSLSSLPGPLWPGVEAPDKFVSMGQIELFDISINTQFKSESFEIEMFEHLNCV